MKLGNKIKKILSIDDENFIVELKFADGTTGEVCLDFIFARPKNLALEISKGNLFKKCYIESGALAWPNGLELCPDSLKMRMTKSTLKKKKVA
jgi:hypothetical protein